MMLKKFRYLALVMALTLVFVSCNTFAAKKKPIKLIFGHHFPVDHYYSKAVLNFKAMVEKNSKGQILVDVFPASQLGSLKEMTQATQSGAQHMFLESLGGLATSYPKLGTFQLPYLVRNERHYAKLLSKGMSLFDEKELTNNTSLSIVALWARSPRYLTTKFPVNKLKDIKGLKIRVPEHPTFLAFWKALGTVPTPIPISDVYTALATGTIDALENCLSDICTFKLYEQTKYFAYTAHMHEVLAIYINAKTWRSLTSAQKKILTAAGSKTSKMVLDAVNNGEKEYWDFLREKGKKVTYPALAPFRERAKTIWGQFGDPALIKKVQALK
jgi:tripartite ATP-independent transporter DctP family solute receptor